MHYKRIPNKKHRRIVYAARKVNDACNAREVYFHIEVCLVDWGSSTNKGYFKKLVVHLEIFFSFLGKYNKTGEGGGHHEGFRSLVAIRTQGRE